MKALHISPVVYGRIRDVRGRVQYLVDVDGEGEHREIPEVVVLRRWRQRRTPGWTFGGSRLSPTAWRALSMLLGSDPATWHPFDPATFEQLRASRQVDLAEARLHAPCADVIAALVATCTARQLTALVDRHAVLAAEHRSGVPDLFLFTRSSRGRYGSGRFVEVKKPDERVSSDQEEEIQFMRELGLEVRVLRLIERQHSSARRITRVAQSAV